MPALCFIVAVYGRVSDAILFLFAISPLDVRLLASKSFIWLPGNSRFSDEVTRRRHHRIRLSSTSRLSIYDVIVSTGRPPVITTVSLDHPRSLRVLIRCVIMHARGTPRTHAAAHCAAMPAIVQRSSVVRCWYIRTRRDCMIWRPNHHSCQFTVPARSMYVRAGALADFNCSLLGGIARRIAYVSSVVIHSFPMNCPYSLSGSETDRAAAV